MTKSSVLFILVGTLASFVIHTDSQVSEMEIFKPASDSPKPEPSMGNFAMSPKSIGLSREPVLCDSIVTMTLNVVPVAPDISFSAVDGSRPLFPTLKGRDLNNNHKKVSESKKRLPGIYIDKYFE